MAKSGVMYAKSFRLSACFANIASTWDELKCVITLFDNTLMSELPIDVSYMMLSIYKLALTIKKMMQPRVNA